MRTTSLAIIGLLSLFLPAPAAAAQDKRFDVFEIAKGQTITGIARQMGIPAGAILDLNPGIDPLDLQEKQRLRIPTDAECQALQIGISYNALYLAAAKDAEALPAFFALNSCRILDGGGGEEYEDDLGALLTKHGDAAFAQALASFSKTAQRAIVREAFNAVADGPLDDPHGKALAALKKKYPLVAAMY